MATQRGIDLEAESGLVGSYQVSTCSAFPAAGTKTYQAQRRLGAIRIVPLLDKMLGSGSSRQAVQQASKQDRLPPARSGLIPTAVPPSESVPGIMGRNTQRRGSLADDAGGAMQQCYKTTLHPYNGDV